MGMSEGLTVEHLGVHGPAGPIVHDVSFAVAPGEIFTLLGESGSGKSLVLQALMGTLPPELGATGRASWNGVDLLALDARQRRRLWGREICLLPQEPWLALDPCMTVAHQVEEVHRHVGGRGRAEAARLAAEGLAAVGLHGFGGHYPHQLSGGMCQRVALAMSHAGEAGLFLADEPTKGLDAAWVADAASGLCAAVSRGQATVVVTHDLAFAARLGGTAAILLEGRLLEQGPVETLLSAPGQDYTRALIAALPEHWPDRRPTQAGPAVIQLRQLSKSYGRRTLFERLDLDLPSGAIAAVTGPSGCGKSTLGNIVLGLARADQGTVWRKPGVPRHRFQKLYQEPPSSFAPTLTIGRGYADLVALHGIDPGALPPILGRLGLAPALLQRLPGQLSGGELQRLSLARSLLLRPAFLFADEPSSRLDPITQQHVLGLLAELVTETGMAMLLVTHDETVASKLAGSLLRLG